MGSTLQTALFLIWAVGSVVTLWAVVPERFRLKPYGLPMSRSAIPGKSVIDTLCTLVWFIYVPAWFVYRWALYNKRAKP